MCAILYSVVCTVASFPGLPHFVFFGLCSLPFPCIILNANRRTKTGEPWEQGYREPTILYYYIFTLLYFYVVCTMLCTTQMALLQFISSGLPKVSWWTFINHCSSFSVCDQISIDDVTESYNCFGDIHSDDVTHVLEHGHVDLKVNTQSCWGYCWQCDFIRVIVMLALPLLFCMLTSYLGHVDRGVVWSWGYCANLAQAMNTSIPFHLSLNTFQLQWNVIEYHS